MSSWKDWFFHNSDKLLLFVIWLISLAFVWYLINRPGISPENVSWAREASGTILGAILGLITGVALARRVSAADRTGDSQ